MQKLIFLVMIISVVFITLTMIFISVTYFAANAIILKTILHQLESYVFLQKIKELKMFQIVIKYFKIFDAFLQQKVVLVISKKAVIAAFLHFFFGLVGVKIRCSVFILFNYVIMSV